MPTVYYLSSHCISIAGGWEGGVGKIHLKKGYEKRFCNGRGVNEKGWF